MYNYRDMYAKALAKALEIGPRKVIIKGEMVYSYVLFRDELEDLFSEKHYATDRVTWLNHICRWTKWDVMVPAKNGEELKKNKGNWCILFGLLGSEEWRIIHNMAMNEDCSYFPELPGGLNA
jgi:hypothetical protein